MIQGLIDRIEIGAGNGRKRMVVVHPSAEGFLNLANEKATSDVVTGVDDGVPTGNRTPVYAVRGR